MDELSIMKGGKGLVLETEALDICIAAREHIVGVCGHDEREDEGIMDGLS